MITIDESDAPEGYKAVYGGNGCFGCFYTGGICRGRIGGHSCEDKFRADGSNVIFKAIDAAPPPNGGKVADETSPTKTLRDEFAIAALSYAFDKESSLYIENAAKYAHLIADAMLEARKK